MNAQRVSAAKFTFVSPWSFLLIHKLHIWYRKSCISEYHISTSKTMKSSLFCKLTIFLGHFNSVHTTTVPNAANSAASVTPLPWSTSGNNSATSTLSRPSSSSCRYANSTASPSSKALCAPDANDLGLAVEHWEGSFYRLARTSYCTKIFHSHNKLRYGRRYRLFVGVTTGELTSLDVGVTLFVPSDRTTGASLLPSQRKQFAVTVRSTSRMAAEFSLSVPGVDLGPATTVDVDITTGLFVIPKRVIKYSASLYEFI